MRRAVLPWLVALGAALLLGAIAVVALNATLFGAGGFVRVYLDAIARADATGALEVPGVRADDLDAQLLDDDALAGLDSVEVVADVELPSGQHLVTARWTAGERSGSTEFVVERTGTRFGLFPDWGFAQSPITSMSLAVLHDPRFTVNGYAAESTLSSDDPVDYALPAPGVYVLDHESRFLEAEAVTVVAEEAGGAEAAELDIRANEAFVEQVQSEVDAHLDECAEQRVLFPSGCPLGREIENRVVSEPQWSIVDYPAVSVVATPTFGEWEVPTAFATAHLVVDVQSLFDGRITTLDEDMTVPLRYRITIEPGDSELRITAVYD